MIPTLRRHRAACALVFILLAPATTQAQGVDPRALATKADADYKAGRFKEAAEAYTESLRQKPNPVFYYAIGQSWRQAGEPEKAAEAYRLYLEKVPKSPKRGEVETYLRALDTQIGERKTASAAEKEREAAAASAAAAAAAAAAAPATPPEHAVAPTPTSAPAASDDRPLTKKWWFWVAVGGAAAVVVGASVAVGVVASRTPAFPETGPGAALVQF